MDMTFSHYKMCQTIKNESIFQKMPFQPDNAKKKCRKVGNNP